MTNYSRIQIRRGTAASWSANNPVLAIGEQALETDTGKLKIGNGTTAYNSLAYVNAAGPTGPTGSIGATGPTGPQGSFGGAVFEYKYLTDQVDSDPGAGNLKFNGTLSGVITTELYIDFLDQNGTDNQNYLNTIDDSSSAIKGHFKVEKAGDPTSYAYYAITGTHYHHGTYYEVPIMYLSGSATSWSNEQDVIVTFVRTGDQGDQGPTGPTGANGKFLVSQTKPTGPTNGDSWFDANTGYTYIYYSDGVNSQWVQTGNANAGPTGPTGAIGPTGATGDFGPTGATGATGAVGATGSSGVISVTGPITNTGTSTAAVIGVNSTVVITTDTQTLSNKRINPRISSGLSFTTYTPNVNDADLFILTGQDQALTYAAPTGSPLGGQKIMFRLKDNGTARSITWNAIYRASADLALPTITVPNKTLYIGFIYNITDTKWDLLSVLGNF